MELFEGFKKRYLRWLIIMKWVIANASGQRCTYNIQSSLHLLKMGGKGEGKFCLSWNFFQVKSLLISLLILKYYIKFGIVKLLWGCIWDNQNETFSLWRVRVDLGSTGTSHGTFPRRHLPRLAAVCAARQGLAVPPRVRMQRAPLKSLRSPSSLCLNKGKKQ